MTCIRCHAMFPSFPLRYEARSTDMSEPASHVDAYRCVTCGHYEDRQVRSNRLAMAGAR